MVGATFAALDFETANHERRSACALGLVVVREGRVAAWRRWLIDPGTEWFAFTHIHGISFEDVSQAPDFGALWPEIRPLVEGRLLAAHNAPFDRSVLEETCDAHGIRFRPKGWICSGRIAKGLLGFRPWRLDAVCDRLRIPLRHHDALSDARACARIVNHAARRHGWEAAVAAGR